VRLHGLPQQASQGSAAVVLGGDSYKCIFQLWAGGWLSHIHNLFLPSLMNLLMPACACRSLSSPCSLGIKLQLPRLPYSSCLPACLPCLHCSALDVACSCCSLGVQVRHEWGPQRCARVAVPSAASSPAHQCCIFHTLLSSVGVQ
jgi:hypothetical protein